jgi:hypothetical protein
MHVFGNNILVFHFWLFRKLGQGIDHDTKSYRCGRDFRDWWQNGDCCMKSYWPGKPFAIRYSSYPAGCYRLRLLPHNSFLLWFRLRVPDARTNSKKNMCCRVKAIMRSTLWCVSVWRSTVASWILLSGVMKTPLDSGYNNIIFVVHLKLVLLCFF